MAIRSLASVSEIENRNRLARLLKNTPIPDEEISANLSLYMRRQDLSHLLFMDMIYNKIIDVHGVIMEFGCRWGRNLALLQNLRGIYEPYNWTRKIIGFDTFKGLKGHSDKDSVCLKDGDFIVPNFYCYTELSSILDIHESNSPINQIGKYEIVSGDIKDTLGLYLNSCKETVMALVYLDMDLYEPTRYVLGMIKDYLVKGSIIVFDEINHPMFPGETQAYRDNPYLCEYRLNRSPLNPSQCWIVIE